MEGIEIIESVLIEENSLLDTVIDKIWVCRNPKGNVEIKLTFSNFRINSRFERIQLIFDDVVRFYFCHGEEHIFYIVSNYKFMQLADGVFYLSLDPDNSTEQLSDDDLDYIYSKKLKLITL